MRSIGRFARAASILLLSRSTRTYSMRIPMTVTTLSHIHIPLTKSSIAVYCLSDIHVDGLKNYEYVLRTCVRLPEDANAYTVLVVPGDVGAEVDRIEGAFHSLVANYDAVCFVPGNHELWRKGTRGISATTPELRDDSTDRMAKDSLIKLVEVVRAAQAIGVHTGPIRLSRGEEDVFIAPLYSWYHATWDTEPDLTDPSFLAVERAVPFDRKWGDFNLCSWPETLVSAQDSSSIYSNSTALADAFAEMNEETLLAVSDRPKNSRLISFSHFVPRQELCIEKRFLIEPHLSKVIGSTPLERQVRLLEPDVHLFGHTHIPIFLELQGIKYLQWPLGYAKEGDRQCRVMREHGPLEVYRSDKGIIDIDLPIAQSMWTSYYRSHPRNPTDMRLAPWVLKRLEDFAGFLAKPEAPQS